eukprot:7157503-Lingulodinium_polyedra.AAC.1
MRAWAARQSQGATGASSHTTPERIAAARTLQAVVGSAPETLVAALGHWLRRHVEFGLTRP